MLVDWSLQLLILLLRIFYTKISKNRRRIRKYLWSKILHCLIFKYYRFNQVTVAYDAKKEEKIQALQNKKAEVEERLREK